MLSLVLLAAKSSQIISLRTEIENVCEETIRSRDAGLGEEFVELLSGLADERGSISFFFLSKGFPTRAILTIVSMLPRPPRVRGELFIFSRSNHHRSAKPSSST